MHASPQPTHARRLRRVLAPVVIATTALVMTACAGDTSGPGSTDAPTENTTVGVALIGPKNDGGVSQAQLTGVENAAENLPLEIVSVVESANTPQKQTDALTSMAQIADVIVGGSVTFVPTASAVAPNFPDTMFLVSGPAAPEEIDNLATMISESGPPAVLAGVTMAMLSKTGTVGVVAGAETADTAQKIAGVTFGAQLINPDAKVVTAITGDYYDVGKARDAAAAQIAQGADQILTSLDTGVEGVYKAIEESGNDVGVFQPLRLDCEQNAAVRGSIIYNSSAMVEATLASFVDGTLHSGAVFYSMNEPEITNFALCPVVEDDAEIAEKVAEVKEQILSGELELPDAVYNTRPAFKFEVR